MDISQFNQCFDVTIVRFELYPAEEPSSWCVGYSIKNKNNHYSMYVDTTVPKELSNDDALHQSWENVKENIKNWAHSVHCKSSLLNSKYCPTC